MMLLSKPLVSVIVPTLDREQELINTLSDVLSQDYPSTEIIVVDQSRTISPEKIQFCSTHKIRYIRRKKKSLPEARNAGIRSAHGDIIVFLDDDIRITYPDFLRTYVKDLEDTGIGAVGGRILQHDNIPVHEITRVGIFNPLTGRVIANLNYDKRVFVHIFGGGNCAFRRNVLKDVGFFNTLIAYTFFYEELEVIIRVEKLGYRILFDPHAEITHLQAPHGGARQKDLYKYHFSYCYNYAILMLCNYPLPLFIIFAARELMKQAGAFVYRRGSKEKRILLQAAFAGIHEAIHIAYTHTSYIRKRRNGQTK